MLRCVLDTDVIIAAMRSPTGASAAILQIAADTSQVRLLASVPLALEYEAKCMETRHWTEAQLSKDYSQELNSVEKSK